MQPSLLVGAGALLAGVAWLFVGTGDSTPATNAAPPTSLAALPIAEGHYVLVVDGDRDHLAITHARAKADPWAGVPKGFTSDWTLVIADDQGETIAEVPLDVSKFDVRPEAKGKPPRAEGCIVRDSHIVMIVNAPRFAAAASYTFSRGEGEARVPLGTFPATLVRELAEETR